MNVPVEDKAAHAMLMCGLIDAGVPQDEAELAAGTCVRALREALDAFVRVTNQLEGRAWSNAYGVGLQLLAATASSRFEEFNGMANQAGLMPRPLVVGAPQ